MSINARFLGSGLAVWPALPVAALANGVFREGVIGPLIGPAAASVVALVTGLGLVAFITVLFLKWVREARSAADLWLLGAIWTVLGIAFWFALFGLVLGVPFGNLLADYDLLDGQLWPLFLAGVLLAPRLVAARLAKGGAKVQHPETPG